MNACRKFKHCLEAAFSGDLAVQERLEWEAHLTNCDACQELAREQALVTEQLAVYRDAPLHQVDVERFVQKVQLQLGDRGPAANAGDRTLTSMERPALAFSRIASVAAAALLTLGVGFYLWQRGGESPGDPSVDSQVAEGGDQSAGDPSGPGVQSTGTPEGVTGGAGGQNPGSPNDRTQDTGAGDSNGQELATQGSAPQVPDNPQTVGPDAHPTDHSTRNANGGWASYTEEGEAFDADRRKRVLAELSAILLAATDRDSYLANTEELRDAGWPMTSMVARMAEDGDDNVAEAAVRALGMETGLQADRKLWDLRKDNRVGSLAVEILVAHGEMDPHRAARLYWENQHRESVRSIWRGLREDEALAAGEALWEFSRKPDWNAETCTDLAGLLELAGSEGRIRALNLLVERNMPRFQWVDAVAQLSSMDTELEGWLESGLETRDRDAALELAQVLPSEHWSPWLRALAGRRSTSSRAVAALALQPDERALQILFDVRTASGVQDSAWLVAWQSAVRIDRQRVMALTKEMMSKVMIQKGHSETLHKYARALLLCDSPAATLSMAYLVGNADLDQSLQHSLLEAVLELGDLASLPALQTGFAKWMHTDPSIAAPIWLALGLIGGEAELRAAMGLTAEASLNRDQERLVELGTPLRSKVKTTRSLRERSYLIERRLHRLQPTTQFSPVE